MLESIPSFIDDYHLPPGEHEHLMSEIEDVFLGTHTRVRRWEDFKTLLKRLCDLNLIPDSILINGSFVTGRKEPGDVDFAALIPPQTIRKALAVDDEHDQEGIKMLLNSNNQSAIRNIFGAHLLIADTPDMFAAWSHLFRKGQYGALREPDPEKDPKWVTRPLEKGIIRVKKEHIIEYIYGGD